MQQANLVAGAKASSGTGYLVLLRWWVQNNTWLGLSERWIFLLLLLKAWKLPVSKDPKYVVDIKKLKLWEGVGSTMNHLSDYWSHFRHRAGVRRTGGPVFLTPQCLEQVSRTWPCDILTIGLLLALCPAHTFLIAGFLYGMLMRGSTTRVMWIFRAFENYSYHCKFMYLNTLKIS